MNNSHQMKQGITRTTLGTVELSKLVRQSLYDEHVLRRAGEKIS
jgi:hypothetical protein